MRHGTNSCYTSGCRCDECRKRWAEYQAEYRRPKTLEEIRHLWPDFQHGAKVGYRKGCRCADCSAAQKVTGQSNIRKKRERFKQDPERYGHGTDTAYQAGCRCDHCKSYQSERMRRKKYGLGPSEIAAMLARQGNCCAVCGRFFTAAQFAVDHDHDTGSVRDLLCVTCNTGLGKFGDSIEQLANAISYLERHRKAT